MVREAPTSFWMLSFLCLGIASAAADPLGDCNSADNTLKLKGCGALISNGQLSKESLAIAYSRRSDAHIATNNFDQAILDGREAVKLEPNRPEHQVRLSDMYRTRGENRLKQNAVDEALADFTEAIAVHKDNDRALAARAQAHLLKKQEDNARTDLADAIRINPSSAEYKSSLVRICEKHAFEHLGASRSDRALADFSEALRFDERNVALLMGRAATYRAMNNTEAAFADYTSALAIQPDLVPAFLNLGELLQLQGRMPQAIDAYGEALKRDPKNYMARMLRGLAYEQSNDPAKAASDFSDALKISPNDPSAKSSLERAKRNAGKQTALVPADLPETKAPAPPSPNTDDRTFKNFANYDLEGGDLRYIKGIDGTACTSACSKDAQCRAYTHDKWNKWCFLKSQVGTLRLDPKYVSGVREDASAPDRSEVSIAIEHYRKKNFPKGRLIKQEKAASYEACEARCSSTTECLAFVYSRKSRQCRLLSEVEEHFPSSETDSGVKRQSLSTTQWE